MREQFIDALTKQPLAHADVIFLAAGDGMNRVPYAAKLYRDGYAPTIAVTSGDTRHDYGSATASILGEALVKEGVPQSALILEDTALNTKEEAERMLEIMKERNFKSVLIVTSPYHQYRAFLTWLAAMKRASTSVMLVNAPAPLSLREDLLAQEFKRIETYRAQGDVASYEEGVDYLQLA